MCCVYVRPFTFLSNWPIFLKHLGGTALSWMLPSGLIFRISTLNDMNVTEMQIIGVV
jgi:hypothetical protein